MRKSLFTALLLIFPLTLLLSFELSIISWNIKDFGKSRDDQEIRLIAEVLRDADIIAIQEVVAKDPGGAQAVARLADELDRMGTKWDYVISNPTNSKSPYLCERYAFLWKKNKAKLMCRPRLISELGNQVEREPYLAVFDVKGNELNILNYHACTHDKDYPERKEISSISNWLLKQEKQNYIWAGDMNLEIYDQAFKLILMKGFNSALNGAKTSLNRSCKNGNYLSSAEDNIIYYFSEIDIKSVKLLDFIACAPCREIEWKRNSYSDHLPLQIEIIVK